jgi:hypothetical protein
MPPKRPIVEIFILRMRHPLEPEHGTSKAPPPAPTWLSHHPHADLIRPPPPFGAAGKTVDTGSTRNPSTFPKGCRNMMAGMLDMVHQELSK